MKLPSLKRMYTRDRCPDDYCCFSSSVHSPIEPAELSNFPHANFHWLPTAKQYFPHKNKTDIGFRLWFGKKDHITLYASYSLPIFYTPDFYSLNEMDEILEKRLVPYVTFLNLMISYVLIFLRAIFLNISKISRS